MQIDVEASRIEFFGQVKLPRSRGIEANIDDAEQIGWKLDAVEQQANVTKTDLFLRSSVFVDRSEGGAHIMRLRKP